MLGNDYYKIEVNGELSNERLKSLVFFYAPLIGDNALYLYQYLFLKKTGIGFNELNGLLNNLRLSVDDFERSIDKLNEYRLVRSLKQNDHYIFVLYEPLNMKEFSKDDVFVRDFILKTSGPYYQEMISTLQYNDSHSGYEDITKTLSIKELQNWTKEDETYLNKEKSKDYDFNTLFDINVFLKDMSVILLPMRFRTKENMYEIARLADLYNISYDRMRNYIADITSYDSDVFDLKALKNKCMYARSEYNKVKDDEYDVPCLTYLMSLQDGKEVTTYDKKIIYNLSNEYHLNPPVINVLLQYGLKNCDNRLLESYLYKIASDLHRNDIKTSKDALRMLEGNSGSKKEKESDKLPVYDTSNNKKLSDEQIKELLALRKN